MFEGPVFQSWVSANSGLKYNPLITTAHVKISHIVDKMFAEQAYEQAAEKFHFNFKLTQG